jgi:hypothetical protein
MRHQLFPLNGAIKMWFAALQSSKRNMETKQDIAYKRKEKSG